MLLRRTRLSGALLLALLGAVSVPTMAATRPDSGIYAFYNVQVLSNEQFVYWTVCGQLSVASGCFNGGSFGPYGVVGALLESAPVTKGNVVTRRIYVLDIASGNSADEVTLYVYKRVDSIIPSFDTVTVSLVKKVTLPITAGATARASMAANSTYLYIGTDASPYRVQVKKSNLAVTLMGAADPAGVTAITVDSNGYVTILQGSNSGESAFTLLGPDGSVLTESRIAYFVLGTANAVVPANLPLFP